jgi:adenylate cyclase
VPTTSSRSRSTTRSSLHVRSLLRIKRYHDTIKTQAAELNKLNRTLEERVRTQVDEIERLRRLRRFLSPQLADEIVSSGDDSVLRSHRSQVAMFFVDLRGWTSFVDTVEPEELMRVLGEFHGTIGSLVKRSDATVGFLEGDGVQLFFNDPIEIPDAALRAVRLGCAPREEMAELTARWRKRGYDLDFGAGIAPGCAARSASRGAPTTRRSERLRISRRGSPTRRPPARS